jgi:uncharacterized protein (DUF885 family)
MSQPRTPTDVDALAEQYLDDFAALDPVEATMLGILDHDDRLPDFTPDWWQSLSELRSKTLAGLDRAEPVDRTDRITIAALRDELEAREAVHAAGEDESNLSVMFSPMQVIRDVFDLMPTATEQHWETVLTRLQAVPASVDGHIASLRWAAERGRVRARRQISACADQCPDYVGPDGFFARFAAQAAPATGQLSGTLAAELAPLRCGLIGEADEEAVRTEVVGALLRALADLPACAHLAALGRPAQ